MNKDNQLIFEAYLKENAQPVCTTGANGTKYWYINDKLHREDGPAVEFANGTKYWYINDKCHREDGPAIEGANGTKFWYINGKRHREDGPAIEYANGTKYWYINGKKYPDAQQWAKAMLQSKNKPAGSNDVQEFLRPILSKQTKDLI